MKTAKHCIRQLFQNIDIAKVIELLSDNTISSDNPDRHLLVNLINISQAQDGHTSEDQQRAMWIYINKDGDDSIEKNHPIQHLYGFVSKLLIEHNYKPLCKFENLLRWQELALYMGEDIFTTAYLADKDARSNRERDYFTWSAVLPSDNFRLSQLLKAGMAENHFHLKGSANHVFLNWLSVMNNPQKARDKLRGQITSTKIDADSRKKMEAILQHIYMAAKIRFEMQNYLSGYQAQIFSRNQGSGCNNSDAEAEKDTQIYNVWDHLGNDTLRINALENAISAYKHLHAHSFQTAGGNMCYLDYAIEENLTDYDRNEFLIYHGERKLLYEWHKRIRKKVGASEKRLLEDCLYVYQLIYMEFRDFFVQNNGKRGFANFSSYEGRKDMFINNTPYEEIRDFLALTGNRSHQNIIHFEARISPKDSYKAARKTLKELNKHAKLRYFMHESTLKYLKKLEGKGANPVSKIQMPEHFYVYHFIKERDKGEKEISTLTSPRHKILREKVKKQALEIAKLRSSPGAEKFQIFGIDAANSEFYARPEVFAQAFRFLNKHLPKRLSYVSESRTLPHLRLSFHAGEDFYDIVDGLRTIDEAIEFCGVSRGDRIGHALAMGIDAKKYYQGHENTLFMPRQILLDNLVWLLERSKEFGIELSNRLEKALSHQCVELFHKIYSDEDSFEPCRYYQAYTLRGDDPMGYIDPNVNIKDKQALTFWERCALKEDERLSVFRKDKKVTNLLRKYHFDPHVKTQGDDSGKLEVDAEYIKIVAALQKKMQEKVNERGIGIEANPTSNRLISQFGEYCEHPIFKWSNLGLTYDQAEVDACTQMFVSINTDDQGVFNTCLENEYALLVLALQKEIKEDGSRKYTDSNIYDWIDRIRKNGIEQSFYQESYEENYSKKEMPE